MRSLLSFMPVPRAGATLVFVALTALSFVQRVRAEVVTLRELEQKAVKSDSLQETNAARDRGAQAEIRKAAAAYYPQVGVRLSSDLAPGRQLVKVCPFSSDIDANQCTSKAEPYLVQGARSLGQKSAFAPYPRSSLDVTVTAPIYDFGRTKAAVQAGKATRASVAQQREVDKEGLVRSVRAAYLSWLHAHEVARMTEEASRDAEERLNRVAALVEEGTRPKVELAPAQTDALLTKLELTRAQGELKSAQTTLEDTVGAPLPADAAPDLGLLDTETQLTPLPDSPDAVLELLYKQRDANYALEGAYAKQRRPEFGVTLTTGVRQQTNKVFPGYLAGVYMSMPLWDGGLAKALAASARAQGDTIAAQLKLHLKQQQQAHRRAEQDVQQANDSLAIAEQLLALSRKRLQDAQQSYELGVTGIEQITEARAVLRRAQTEVLMSRIAHAEARLRFAPIEGVSAAAE